jgi:hypothetical protein
MVIQNCEFFSGNATGLSTDNFAAIWMDGAGDTTNLITNNYFHDNVGNVSGGQEHLGAIFVFDSLGVQVTSNTCVSAGSFWGKDANVRGSTLAYNYLDNSLLTARSGDGPVGCLYDWTGVFSGAGPFTQTTFVHHNIVVANAWGIALRGASNYEGWKSPLQCYNNTTVLVSGPSAYPGLWAAGQPSAANAIQVYNNITMAAQSDSSGYGTIRTSPLAINLWDYNGYSSSHVNWKLIADSPGTSGGTTLATYSTDAAFSAGVVTNGGVSGSDSHAVSAASANFTGAGTFADQYQLAGGSAFLGAGQGGVDMGAWQGGVRPGATWVT